MGIREPKNFRFPLRIASSVGARVEELVRVSTGEWVGRFWGSTDRKTSVFRYELLPAWEGWVEELVRVSFGGIAEAADLRLFLPFCESVGAAVFRKRIANEPNPSPAKLRECDSFFGGQDGDPFENSPI